MFVSGKNILEKKVINEIIQNIGIFSNIIQNVKSLASIVAEEFAIGQGAGSSL